MGSYERVRGHRRLYNTGNLPSSRGPGLTIRAGHHTSPDPDLDRITLKHSQKMGAKRRPQPSLPKMPWDER